MAVRVSNGARGVNGSSGNGRAADRDARLAELMRDREFVQAYCERILGDAASAEDMVQDTYLQAFRHLDRLEQRDSYRPWLATVALHRCRNEIRRRSKVSPTDEIPDAALPAESCPEHLVLCEESLDETIAALRELSTREQELIRRQSCEDVSIVELALEDGSTPASVKSVLWRGRSKLREMVGDLGHQVLFPVFGLAGYVRRHAANAATRLQQAVPFASGLERAGEAVVAAVAVLALGPAPAVPDAALAATSDTSVSPVASLAVFATPVAEDEPEAGIRGEPIAPLSRDQTSGPVTSTTVAPSPESDDRPPLIPGAVPDPRDVDEHAPAPAPESPTPRDEADDPEGAFFDDIVWVEGHDAAPSDQHVFALGEIRYRCDADCAVLFHSADGGARWDKLAAEGIGDSPSDLMVSPAYPDDPRIFVMTASGLRRSSDGGHTFEAVKEPHVGPAAMSPGFGRGDDRILVGAGPGWVYDASADFTAPFHPGAFQTPNYVHFAFAPGHHDIVFAGHFVHGEGGTKSPVVTRCDAGKCAQRASLGRSTQPPRVSVPPGYATTGLVLAWHDGGLFRSDDAGATFEQVELPSAEHVSPKIEAVTSGADGDLYLAWWDQHNGDRFGGVLRSTDGGQMWQPIGDDARLVEGVHTVASSESGRVLAAPQWDPQGGILCSADRGSTWLPRCPGESS